MMKKIISLCVAVFILTCSAVSAAYDISFDANSGLLEISGKTMQDSIVSLMLLKHGIEFDDSAKTVNDGDVLYCDQCRAQNGSFLFQIDFDGVSGNYNMCITDSASSERTQASVSLVNPASYSSAVASINTASDGDFETTFKSAFDINKTNLGFDYTLLATDDALKILKQSIKTSKLKTDEYNKNLKIYKTACIISALNSSTLTDIKTVIDDLYFVDERIKNDFETVSKINGASTLITKKVSGGGLESIDEFYEKLSQAIVFGGVRYADGTGSILKLLESYGQLFGISKPINYNACEKLNGNSYGTKEELKNAYDSASNENKSSGTGGVAGGGTRTSNSKTGIANMDISTGMYATQSPVLRPVNIVFNDIEGYDWATEAIVGLCDKGIISGKGNGRFAPGDYLTREECARILVGAMGYGEENENVFVDALEGTWYIGWINKAAKLGICNGIGDGRFGVGENITRQDLCVMIVNALKVKGIAVETAELPFTDNNSISDYAREAVSVLYKMEAVHGANENEFLPLRSTTRAEGAKIIYAILKYLQ